MTTPTPASAAPGTAPTSASAPGTAPTSASAAPGTAPTPAAAPLPAFGPVDETGGAGREATGLEIAVIGLSCRFPGAEDAHRYWANLAGGVESLTRLTPGELAERGVPAVLRERPDFVPVQGALAGADRFDARFFGISPREAALMDPQHRVLLEESWHALEDAGYDPGAVPATTGVYVGAYYNTYAANLEGHVDTDDPGDVFARDLAGEKDYLATRIAYKLGLTGPAMTVQTACSTSLVAVHTACQALLAGSCDVALAGGATVRAQQTGYRHQTGGIYSADGHCRPFDAAAQGTVAGNGVGVVVLKRLQDALADGDPVRAVILGSAVGNDGSDRVGFTAPGADGQARVIRRALAAADIDPGSVTYVEAHGSATPIGDPIEIEALTRAYGTSGRAPGSVAIGSVKGNIGHTHAASGVAGLIKTVLALQHRQVPPSINFERPNPHIDFGATPFRVAAELTPWPTDGHPRRAGVSSFGMGGTGAHVVLQEAPAAGPARQGHDGWQLIPLSGRTPEAVAAAGRRLADRLEDAAGLTQDGVARTLQTGRRHFAHRRAVVTRDLAHTRSALRGDDPRAVVEGRTGGRPPSVAFAFPGLGDQYPGMGAGLYAAHPVFRAAVDACAAAFRPHLGMDLRTLLRPPTASATPAATFEDSGLDLRAMLGRSAGPADGTTRPLDRTLFAQPAVFTVEYALARLWQSWGIRPGALVGYSLGEYVAACVAGVLALEDAVTLVARRARLIDGLPGGSMLAVGLPERRVRALLGDGLSLAAVNGPELCVVAGTGRAVSALARRLAEQRVPARALRTTHAFHSHLMEPVAGEFAETVAKVELHAPRVPYVSNVTGDWVGADEVRDPEYWVRHLLEPVRFADGVARLWEDPDRFLLEAGPGHTLSSLALAARPRGREGAGACASLPGPYDRQSEEGFVLRALGRLWTAGAEPDWDALTPGATPARVALPGYPFARTRHWLDPVPAAAPRPTAAAAACPTTAAAARPTAPVAESAAAATGPAAAAPPARKEDLADWFSVPVWEPLPPHPAPGARPSGEAASWLLLVDEEGLGTALAERLAAVGHRVTTVRAARSYGREPDGGYLIDPTAQDHYTRLVADLRADGGVPARVVHLWSIGTDRDPRQPRPSGDPAAPVTGLSRAVVGSSCVAGPGGDPAGPVRALSRVAGSGGDPVGPVRGSSCVAGPGGDPAGPVRALSRVADSGGDPARAGADADLRRRLDLGVLSVLRLHRATAGRCGGLDLVLVSSDAHAVLGTEPVDPVQAMLTGPALVLPLEQPDLTCRVVDISLTQPRAWGDRDADSLLGELTAPAADPVVALRGGRRWRRGHRPVRLPDTVATPVLRPGGVYLITGGFGGVGLTLARHLATAVGARLVLVGRSPLPPGDEWDSLLAAAPDDDPAAVRVRAVRELEDLGAEVLAVDADVADPARMEEVAALAVARFGAVDGIVHAAGVPAAGAAQLKDDAEILRVLAPKVSGGLAVDRLARLLRPDFTVLCSSTLALTGGLGQVDYAAGNAFLAALAQRNDLLGGPVTVAVDWDGWQRVGMAARIVGRSADTGAAVGPVDHPLVRACLADDADTAVYRVPLSVADSWLVDEHRMAGSAVVPGTGHLELVRAAWQHQTGERTAELRDVTFLAPVVVADDEHRELRVVLDKRQLPYRFTVLAGPAGPASGAAGTPGQDWRVHATGRVGPLTEATPDRWDASELVRRGAMRDLGAVEHRGPMGFGPRSRCLRRVHLGSREALAELELPEEFGTDLDRIHLHPSLLDLAAGFHGMNLAEEFRIPLSYGRLLLHAPLPRRLFSHHRFHEADRRGKETLTSDVTLFDEHGRVVARVEGFVLKRVADLTGRIAELRAGTSPDAVVQPLPVPAPALAPVPAPVSAPGRGSGQLDGHLATGILPEEGVTALLRLLAAGIGPQVAVATKDLDAVRDDIRRTSSAMSRPAGDSGAPAGTRADDDRTDPTPDDLARLWAELLGVRRVAPHDSFFELGGHSLLGLQMIARIRDRFGVEIGLDSLYETPTAAGLSALLCAAADEPRTAPSPA